MNTVLKWKVEILSIIILSSKYYKYLQYSNKVMQNQ